MQGALELVGLRWFRRPAVVADAAAGVVAQSRDLVSAHRHEQMTVPHPSDGTTLEYISSGTQYLFADAYRLP